MPEFLTNISPRHSFCLCTPIGLPMYKSSLMISHYITSPLAAAGEGEAPPTSPSPWHLVGVLNTLDEGEGTSRAAISLWLIRSGVLGKPLTIGERNASP